MTSALHDTTPARLGGLDGLRAIAVISVILFHYLPTTMTGGFLGVDLFFVISGYLITTLLVRERDASGRIGLGAFWQRRARRLLPALVAMVLVTTSWALAVGGDVLVGIGWQLLGAATFSYNWLAIANSGDYFAGTGADLYQNLWSLAVEEQFYLLWPLLLILVLAVRSRRVRFAVVLAAALASGILMVAMSFGPASLTRLYFGTDTHSFGLLIGAAAALLPRGVGAIRRRGMSIALATVVGVLMAGGIALLVALPVDSTPAYRGGMLAFSTMTALVLLALERLPRLASSLDVAPLRWIGRRSYGLYLWHWPVLILVSASLPAAAAAGARGPGEAAVELSIVITVVAALLSYRFIELPLRRRGFRASTTVATARISRGGWRTRAIGASAAVALLALSVGLAGAVAAAPQQTEAEQQITAGQQLLAESQNATPTPTPAAVDPTPDPAASTPPTGDQITAIGDSVMLASYRELVATFPGIYVDAAVSRQMKEVPAILQGLADAGALRDYIVIGLGTNGSFGAGVLDQVTAIVGPERHIVVITAFAPRGWTPGVNATLHAYADHQRMVGLADWSAAIEPHIDLLSGDHIHPGPTGGQIYASTVQAALAKVALVTRPSQISPTRWVEHAPPGTH